MAGSQVSFTLDESHLEATAKIQSDHVREVLHQRKLQPSQSNEGETTYSRQTAAGEQGGWPQMQERVTHGTTRFPA